MSDYPVSAILSAVDKGFTSTLDAASGAVSDFESTTSKIGKGMTSVGNVMTAGITTPVVALGTAAAKTATDFDSAMAKVSTIANTDASKGGKSIEDFKKEIISLSEETGIAASDIANNVYDAISAGQDTADAVSFVSNATKLAKAGFTSSESALDILTTAMNAYGLEAEDVTKVSDILISTQNLGKTTVDQLASSMGKVIPTAKANGVQLEDLAGCYAVMTSNGIATAETTTYLNSMLNELGKQGTTAADAFAKGTEHIKEGGLTMAEAMEQGWELTDILSILDEQAAESGTSIGNMFGSAEAGKAATVLWDNASKLNDAVDAMGDSAGATETAFAKMDNTTEASLEKMKNSAINSLIAIGDTILPVVVPAVTTLTEKIQKLTEWFGNLSPETQSMILKIAAVAAAAGPVLAIGGKAVTLLGGIGSKVGGLLTPVGGLTGKLTEMKPAATGGSSALQALSKNAVGLIALGAAILMISAGFWILSQAAIGLANAGPVAIGVMFGLVGAVAALAFAMVAMIQVLAPMAPQMAAVSVGLLAMGAAVVLIAAGFWILAQAATQVAASGNTAIAVMFGMIGAIAGLMAVAALLGPILTAGAVGFLAFGAAILMVGTGALMAAAGLAIVSGALPGLTRYGASGSAAILKLSTSILALSGSAVAAGAAAVVLGGGLIVLGAGALTGSVGMAAFAVAVTAAAAGTALLEAGLLIVGSSMSSISKNAGKAEKSLVNMESSINIVSSGLKKLGDLAGEAVKGLVSAFNKGEGDAKTAAGRISTGVETGLKTGMNKVPAVAAMAMMLFASTITSSGRIAVMSANSTGNQIVAILQSSSNGAFNAGTMIGLGLARGMDAARGTVMASAAALAAASHQAIVAKAKIGSPSRVEEKDGGYIGLGLAKGLEKKKEDVWAAMQSLYRIPSASLPVDDIGLSDDYSYGSNKPIVVESVIEIDKRELGRVMVATNEAELNRKNRYDSRRIGVR